MRKYILSIVFLIFTLVGTNAQSSLDTTLQKYSTQFPQEKIHLGELCLSPVGLSSVTKLAQIGRAHV